MFLSAKSILELDVNSTCIMSTIIVMVHYMSLCVTANIGVCNGVISMMSEDIVSPLCHKVS